MNEDKESIKKRVLEDVDPKLRRRKIKERRRQRLIVTLQFLALIVLMLLVFYLMMGVSTVKGNSMYPTLHDQDMVLYYRRQREYAPGDIVVLDRPGGDEFVKRIVAVAGDTVNIQGGVVYINGEKESFEGSVGDTGTDSEEIEYPLTVGDREVFVLGDNREISEDSRRFGAVSLEDVRGKIKWYVGSP